MKSCRWLVLAALLCLTISAQAREKVPLMDQWKFIREDAAHASDVNFDDQTWSAVSLPHTWNSTDSVGNSQKYYRGVGWYRRHFTSNIDSMRQCAFLHFGACGSYADIYVNGQLAGSHIGAFQGFNIDITKLLKSGDNVIAVKATNARNLDIAPIAGDFNVQGGLYRDASLIITPGVHLVAESNDPGVLDLSQQLSDRHAWLIANVHYRNDNRDNRTVTTRLEALDAAGKVVAVAEENVSEAGLAYAILPMKLSIDNPRLWNGKADPYLYTIRATVTDDKGETDSVSSHIGFRTYSIDPQKGFFLNGKSYPLHGVNRHQDKAGKGWAISDADMDEDMALCKELGITAIRLAHYQHAQHFYDLCDQNGIIVWAELCLVNNVTLSDAFAKNTMQMLTELITQNRNHPSICFWSLYNELDLNAKTKEDKDRQFSLIPELNDLAHKLDPSRLTTAANMHSIGDRMSWSTDVIAINRYYGWYTDKPEIWARELDKVHAAFPDKCIGVSEYGAGGSVKQQGIFSTTQPLNKWKFHTEEGQAYVHENAFGAMRSREWLWGTFLWCFADFGVSGRNEGDTPGINDKGLLTFDRKTKKDVFYLYKAAWSDEPVLYIAGRRNKSRQEKQLSIHVYTNLKDPELMCDGQLVKLNPTDNPNVFVSDQVELKDGDNSIKLAAQFGGTLIGDQCVFTH